MRRVRPNRGAGSTPQEAPMSTKQLAREGRQFLQLLRLEGFRAMTPGAKVWAICCVAAITSPVWLAVLYYTGAWLYMV